MQQPVSIEIEDVEWDENNLGHAARHEISPALVEALRQDKPLFRENPADRAGDYQMIGRDKQGRLWTIILKYLGEKRARPITGWPSTTAEHRWYIQNQTEENENG